LHGAKFAIFVRIRGVGAIGGNGRFTMMVDSAASDRAPWPGDYAAKRPAAGTLVFA
jgi:hypothetical protein